MSQAIVAPIGDSIIKEIITTLSSLIDGARTVVIVIHNETELTFHLQEHHHDSGGWAVVPDRVLRPKTTMVFGAKDKGLGTGTVGRMLWRSEGTDKVYVRMYWANPYLGSNEASTVTFRYEPSVGGPEVEHEKYESDRDWTSGNTGAQMVYWIRKRGA